MGLFRRSKNSSDDNDSSGHGRKLSTYDVHDPVLTAIRDEEPFQMSAHGYSNGTSLSPEMHMRDIFGNPIDRPDRSNPSRPRNERPLDTIRAFEYACTGDERLRDEMETAKLGWATRSNFAAMPHFESNPYAMASSSATTSNMISFNSPQTGNGDSLGGIAAPQAPPQKKKKRGFFGRKKK